MIFQNLKLAARNLLKNRTVSAINIAGLTIGITISLLIFTFVRKEITTDSFIPDNQNIYALMNQGAPHVSLEMAKLAKHEIPEIENITSCSEEWSPQIFFSNKGTSFKIENLLVADSAFFRVFRFEPVWGNPNEAFFLPNKVVLTQSIATKIFGDKNPVGEMLDYNSTYLQNEKIEVAAVIKDLPHNSSWNFEAVLSIKTDFKIDWYYKNLGWGQQSFTTFFTLPGNVNSLEVNKKLAGISTANVPEYYKDNIDFGLFPLSRVYFHSPEHDILKHGNIFTLSVIEITGILILLLACVNYINLVTAQRDKRNKNVGIIKALGSSKRKVIEMLTTESALTLVFVILLVGAATKTLTGSFNQLTNSQFSFSTIFSGWNLIILFSIFVFTLLVTGLVPGYIFSKNKTTLLLKNKSVSLRSNYLRNGLLVFQFTISIALISGILFINRQNNFLNKINPGFEKENIIYANTNDDILNNIQYFKNELKKIPGINDITFSEEALGKIDQNWVMDFVQDNEKVNINFVKVNVTPNFFYFFGIKVIYGKSFSENSAEKKEMLFNTTAFQKFDYAEIGKTRLPVSNDPTNGFIVGEVEDFNFESMHVPIRPIGFMCSGEGDEVVYLKLNATDISNFDKTLAEIKKVWGETSPNFPFEYQFLDDSWKAMYTQEKQFQKVLSYTTIISLFLSCLGLIGLTFFMIENKIKEIGIRKVNGAKISEILLLLNKDFLKWIIIAFLFATPVTWFAMQKWLENFAYKTSLSWWIFALAELLAIGIALLTVSLQSWKAATRNPVEALRYE